MHLKKTIRSIRRTIVGAVNKYIRMRGVNIANYFCGIDKVYIASADQFAGLEEIVESKNIRQCKHFYSVIGGMGGLNILSCLSNLESITFFDINPNARTIFDIYYKLIIASHDRNDFISLFYGRAFDASLYNIQNQHEYYSLPIDDNYHNRVKDILGDELFSQFTMIYVPYIQNPLSDTYEGVTLHATRMPIFHAAPMESVMTYPFYSRLELKLRRISCVNSFFMGKGWLQSEESFRKVKSLLSTTPVQVEILPLHEIIPHEDSGLYASNVVDRDYIGLSEALSQYKWTIAYSPLSNYLKVECIPQQKRIIPLDKVYAEGVTNPHESCCMLLDDQLKLNDNPFLEIIEPHSIDGMDYGFRFYPGQYAISTEDFMGNGIPENLPKIIGIHMLMGCGVNPGSWERVVTKAYLLYAANDNINSLFIFEHNKSCLDWPEEDVNLDTLLEEEEIDTILLSLDSHWKKYGAVSLTGDVSNIRNLCWILRKEIWQ